MKNKKTPIIILIIIFLAAACAAAVYFVKNPNTDTAFVTTTAPASNDSEETTVPAKYAEYKSRNKDFVGWIKIDGTRVDYPVVQTDDNSFYLNHNFEKEYYERGSIYMDYSCNPDDYDTNTVIYGHNWLDKTMFSQVTKYDEIDFLKKHPIIEFNSPTKINKWKIFGVVITSASESEDNGYVFNYIYPYMNGENFNGFINEINKRNLYNIPVDVDEGDKILTLSTCTRKLDTSDYRADIRLVVFARMVREGELPEIDTSSITANPNPKYPQIWYDLKKIENPYKSDIPWYPKEIVK